MKKTSLIIAALLAAPLLSACANTTTVPRPVPNYVYTRYPVTQLNIGSVNVVEGYTMPMRSPNAEQLMPDPLPQAVAQWARSHFKANGGDGTLTITVKDASVVKQDLTPGKGVKGVFTVDQTEKYTAHISVEFAVADTTAGTSGSGSVNISRSQTIAENASLEDRDVIWTRMAEQMMIDLDAGAQTMLHNKLGFLLQK